MTRHRAPGRRRAPGSIRRLPDGFSRLGASWAVKSVASLGVVGGAAAALALPVGAESGTAALSLPASASSSAIEGRAEGLAASRSTSRAAQAPAPAVSAPADAAPAAPEQVGVAGLKAVAKPKPKPKPEPKETSTSSGSSSSSSSSSSDTSRPSVSGISAKCSGLGLTNRAAILCTAVQKKFGLSNIGGYRPNAGEHSTGQAVDFMTSGSTGDAIADFVLANAGTYNVKYVIWKQRYREPGGSWEMMEDRGSATANHYDHVHVTVN